MRERTSRRHVAIPAGFLVGALLLALASSERGETSLEAPLPSLSVVDTLVPEGTGGSSVATLRIRLSASATAPVTVDWATADAGATAPADYEARSGTAVFAPGEVEKAVLVPVVPDSLDEMHENFALDLSDPSGATTADGRGFATIVDDDPEVLVSVADASGWEGEPLTFSIRLAGASGKLITLEWVTSGSSATSGVDFAAGSGMVSFAAGEVEKTVTVATHEDALVEGDETFTVTLLRPANVVLADAVAVGTIRDDDELPGSGGGGGDPPGGGSGPGEEPPNAAPSCANVKPSLTRLWLPNHRFRLVSLSGASDPDGDAVALEIVGVTQDEPIRGTGKGDKAPDAAWVPGRPHQVKLRAERAGRGDGRVYRLAYTASDSRGANCSGTALAGVPHDARRRWVDSGGVWDSFGL